MPTTTKKKFIRKNPKLETVTFKLPEIFGDADFEVPHFQHVSVNTVKKLERNGDIGAVQDFLEANGATEEAEAFGELGMAEAREFLTAWQAASESDFPKS